MCGVMQKNMTGNKYKFLYEYARTSLDEDLEHFKNIEDKASKFMGFLTILIAGYTAVIKFASDIFFPPNGLLAWCTLITIICTYIALVSAWGHLFMSLRIIYAPRMPFNNYVIDMIENNSLVTTYWALSQTCKKTLEKSRSVIESKAKNLQIAYQDIGYSAWIMSISLIMLTVCKYYKQP